MPLRLLLLFFYFNEKKIFLSHNSFIFKTSWKRTEDILKDERFYALQDKKFLRRRGLRDLFKTCIEDVLKTLWRSINVSWVRPYRHFLADFLSGQGVSFWIYWVWWYGVSCNWVNPNLSGGMGGAKFVIPYLSQSSDINKNSDGCISDFWISGQSLIKRNCHTSRTSEYIDMKLGPVTKLDKRNKATSKKKLTMTPCQKILTSLPFLQFTSNLEQSGSVTPDDETIFSLTVTLYLTAIENEIKKFLTQLSHNRFE